MKKKSVDAFADEVKSVQINEIETKLEIAILCLRFPVFIITIIAYFDNFSDDFLSTGSGPVIPFFVYSIHSQHRPNSFDLNILNEFRFRFQFECWSIFTSLRMLSHSNSWRSQSTYFLHWHACSGLWVLIKVSKQQENDILIANVWMKEKKTKKEIKMCWHFIIRKWPGRRHCRNRLIVFRRNLLEWVSHFGIVASPFVCHVGRTIDILSCASIMSLVDDDKSNGQTKFCRNPDAHMKQAKL